MNMKVKGKHPRGRPRSRKGKERCHTGGGMWEEIEDEMELWEEGRWRGLVIRQPT
jgi:hypothetical protein